MGEKKSTAKLYKKFIDNTISPGELKVLLDYLGKTDDEKLAPLKKALLKKQRLDELPKVRSLKKDDLRTRLEVRIHKENQEQDRIPGKRRVFGTSSPHRAAIIVAMLIFISFGASIFLRRLTVKRNARVYKTADDKKKRVLLPDSSVVWLKGVSKLTVPGTFNNDMREVNLEGEAFFEIRHLPGIPFVVESRKVKTTVMGTAFRVRAYPSDPQVAVEVVTGKVKVSYPVAAREALVLGANESALVDLARGEFIKAPREIDDLDTREMLVLT